MANPPGQGKSATREGQNSSRVYILANFLLPTLRLGGSRVGQDVATDDDTTMTTRRVNNGAHFAPLVKYDKWTERREEMRSEEGEKNRRKMNGAEMKSCATLSPGGLGEC